VEVPERVELAVLLLVAEAVLVAVEVEVEVGLQMNGQGDEITGYRER
jgi:hypothetical protein